MIVCAKCNRRMRPKKNGTPFVEMAQDKPYKLWMADLWECQDCGSLVLHTDARQVPIAQSFEPDFADRLRIYKPEFQSRDFTRQSQGEK